MADESPGSCMSKSHRLQRTPAGEIDLATIELRTADIENLHQLAARCKRKQADIQTSTDAIRVECENCRDSFWRHYRAAHQKWCCQCRAERKLKRVLAYQGHGCCPGYPKIGFQFQSMD